MLMDGQAMSLGQPCISMGQPSIPLRRPVLPLSLRLKGGMPEHVSLGTDHKHWFPLKKEKEERVSRMQGGTGDSSQLKQSANSSVKWKRLSLYIHAHQLQSLLVMATVFYTLNRIFFGLLSVFSGISDLKRRNLFASCCVSMFHSITVSLLSFHELRGRGWKLLGWTGLGGGNGPDFDLTSKNTCTGVATIIFCTAYMLADLLFMYTWCPEETIWILHHWATLVYMCTTLATGAGDLSTCLCIFLGELTAPINNVIVMSDILNSEKLLSSAKAINRLATALLATAFLSLRVLYAPFGICFVLCKSLLLDPKASALSLPVRLVWTALPIVVTKSSADHFLGLVASLLADTTTTLAKEAAKKK